MKWLGILTVIAGLVVVGVSNLVYNGTTGDTQTTGEKVAGVLLIILAMVFTGLQARGNKNRKYYIHIILFRWCMKNVLLLNIIFHHYKSLVGREYLAFLHLVY
jgi:drug/metabolite transporter (DMT)-like permease